MKKSYEKPEVAQVKLAHDEAVLGHCKTTPFTLPTGEVICRETGAIQTFGS